MWFLNAQTETSGNSPLKLLNQMQLSTISRFRGRLSGKAWAASQLQANGDFRLIEEETGLNADCYDVLSRDRRQLRIVARLPHRAELEVE